MQTNVYTQVGLTSFNSSLAKVTSENVKTLGLINTDDALIWQYAKVNGFVIVSKDADFQQRSLVYGHPPKFIYLRIGNSPTSKITQILRDNFAIINEFIDSEVESILVFLSSYKKLGISKAIFQVF